MIIDSSFCHSYKEDLVNFNSNISEKTLKASNTGFIGKFNDFGSS